MWILIAFVAAIGLTALAIMAIFGEFGSASSSQSAQSVVTGVSAIISNILTDYAGNPNFANLSTATAIQDNAVPASWLPSGASSTTIDLPSGGTAKIAPANIGTGGSNNGFTLTLSNLNRATCAQFGTFYTPNVSSIAVGSDTATNPDYAGGTGSNWPPALASGCNATGGSTVTITVAGQ